MLVHNSIWLATMTDLAMAQARTAIEAEQIVCGMTQVLFAAKVTLRRLNRSVAKQELNLINVAAVCMAQLRAGPAQIVGSL